MKITCLGTGSPEPYIQRASSGYLVEIGNDKILLDCGGGVVSRLIEAGHLPSHITHLFFTHLHSDHMMDYARLVHCAWDEGAKPLPVYGPAPISNINDKLFGKEGGNVGFKQFLILSASRTGSESLIQTITRIHKWLLWCQTTMELNM